MCIYWYLWTCQKSLKIPKRYSEAVIRKRQTIQWTIDKGQTTICKTLHRKLKIEQMLPHKTLRVNYVNWPYTVRTSHFWLYFPTIYLYILLMKFFDFLPCQSILKLSELNNNISQFSKAFCWSHFFKLYTLYAYSVGSTFCIVKSVT